MVSRLDYYRESREEVTPQRYTPSHLFVGRAANSAGSLGKLLSYYLWCSIDVLAIRLCTLLANALYFAQAYSAGRQMCLESLQEMIRGVFGPQMDARPYILAKHVCRIFLAPRLRLY
jgi:hypothetical protein